MSSSSDSKHRISRFLKFDLTVLARYSGKSVICGIDEAGRGCIAGPVVACAIILPLDKGQLLLKKLRGVNDSKKTARNTRERLYVALREVSLDHSLGTVDNAGIDSVNIYNATIIAMKEALRGLKLKPDIVITDYMRFVWEKPLLAVKFGDSLSLSVACASVMAKVYRDKIMCELDKKYPEYGFAMHKGYATAHHRNMIRKHGSCRIHRMSFSPLKEMRFR